jgi:hypothetical protein
MIVVMRYRSWYLFPFQGLMKQSSLDDSFTLDGDSNGGSGGGGNNNNDDDGDEDSGVGGGDSDKANNGDGDSVDGEDGAVRNGSEMRNGADDELREIEERRRMEESGLVPGPPSPRPATPVPHRGKGTQRLRLWI